MKRTVKTFPSSRFACQSIPPVLLIYDFEFPGDNFIDYLFVAIAVHVPVAFETAVDVDNRATGDRVEVADSRSGK